MGYPLIESYRREKARLERASKTKNETALRKAFLRLAEAYGERRDLILVDELPLTKQARPDATLRTIMGLDIGWIENKDRYDNLEAEIRLKFEKGHPSSNIIFENGRNVVLYQNNARIAKIDIDDTDALNSVLTTFTSFERPEEAQLRDAIEAFKSDLPDIIRHLRNAIDEEYASNEAFSKKSGEFLGTIQAAINPSLTAADVIEMLIQHILTEDIFLYILRNRYPSG